MRAEVLSSIGVGDIVLDALAVLLGLALPTLYSVAGSSTFLLGTSAKTLEEASLFHLH